jgi:hypothetical protein
MQTIRIARSLPMSSFDKSPMRKKTKRKTKETAKKMTRMKTETTATLSERSLICVSGEG